MKVNEWELRVVRGEKKHTLFKAFEGIQAMIQPAIQLGMIQRASIYCCV